MHTVEECPVCASRTWTRGPAYRYLRENADTPRRRALFAAWFPDADEVTLTAQVCRACGLACYSPRPDEADVEAKYAYLYEHEEAAPPGRLPQLKWHDGVRGQRVHRHLAPRLGDARTVLDVGGGHGQLLEPFVRRGLTCSVVDYLDEVVPGVSRAGDTLDDLPSGDEYDVVICSHVLEHVADPRGLLTRIRAHLAPGGLVYAEVPLEIWRGIPIGGDPVTHVSFFSPDSMRTLFRATGWTVHLERARRFPRETSQVLGVVVASPARPDPAPLPGSEPDGLRLLAPTLVQRGRYELAKHRRRAAGRYARARARAVGRVAARGPASDPPPPACDA